EPAARARRSAPRSGAARSGRGPGDRSRLQGVQGSAWIFRLKKSGIRSSCLFSPFLPFSCLLLEVAVAPSWSRPEDLRELVRSRDLELIVAAIARLLVRPPPQEYGAVTKA